MTDLVQRLRDRKLVQWALAYAAAAWLALQTMNLVAGKRPFDEIRVAQ